MPRIRKPVEENNYAATAVLDEDVLDEPVLDEDVLDAPGVAAEPSSPVAEPAPPPDPSPVAADVLARRAAELAVAEQLFVRQVAGETLTPDELEFLRHLWPDQYDRSREMSRVAKYVKLRRTAGSRSDRDAADQAAQQTAAKLASEGPAIVAKIAELQASLQTLEKSAADAQAEHDRRVQAVDALRDPVHLGEPHRSRFEAARQRWERDHGRPSRELRHQADGYRRLAGLDAERDPDAIAAYAYTTKAPEALVTTKIENVCPSIRSSEVRDKRFNIVNRVAWAAHVEELRAKADAAEAEASRLEEAGQGLRAELDGMLAALIPD